MIYTTMALLSLNGAAALSSAALPCSVRPRAATSIHMGIGSEEMCAEAGCTLAHKMACVARSTASPSLQAWYADISISFDAGCLSLLMLSMS